MLHVWPKQNRAIKIKCQDHFLFNDLSQLGTGLQTGTDFKAGKKCNLNTKILLSYYYFQILFMNVISMI